MQSREQAGAREAGAAALDALLKPEAVRGRAAALLALAERDALPHFRLQPGRLDAAAGLVAETTRASYPDLKVPLHSRWRHFELDGTDLWAPVRDAAGLTGDALARARFDLAVVSVLLDAGAGPDWRYEDAATGRTYVRSEGLALASLRAFAAGAFSDAPETDPLRADPGRLAALTAGDLAALFQVSDGNPLLGLDGRAALLNAVGRTLAARPAVLFDDLRRAAVGKGVQARDILIAVLRRLNPVWPSGLTVGGVALGDVGRHAALRRDDASDGLVPFHKLSQWLSYSLVEPLQEAGLEVSDLDGLTGLPEYRNGGLFLDTGVLEPRAPLPAALPADAEPVVEWRALTVALLDRLAPLVRLRLGLGDDELPLGAVLQGGTWAAGRALARERRDGRPPFAILSDGTVF